jgi:hypothetical protein
MGGHEVFYLQRVYYWALPIYELIKEEYEVTEQVCLMVVVYTVN